MRIFNREKIRSEIVNRTLGVGMPQAGAIVDAICDEFEEAFDRMLERADVQLLERASVALAVKAIEREKDPKAQIVEPTPSMSLLEFVPQMYQTHVEALRVRISPPARILQWGLNSLTCVINNSDIGTIIELARSLGWALQRATRYVPI